MRQFVPTLIPLNLLQHPIRGSRPLWAYRPFIGCSKDPLGFIISLISKKQSVPQLATRLLSESNYSIVKVIVFSYSDFRFSKFLSKFKICL